MWANAQRDGRPAEYRWRPVLNAAKFGSRPLLDCRAVTLPIRERKTWRMQSEFCSCLKKIFSTNSQEVISECCNMFHCLPAGDVIAKRKKKFLLRFVNSDNLLCNVFHNIANKDLAALAN